MQPAPGQKIAHGVGNVLAVHLTTVRWSSAPTNLSFSHQTDKQGYCRRVFFFVVVLLFKKRHFRLDSVNPSLIPGGHRCFRKEASACAAAKVKASSPQLQAPLWQTPCNFTYRQLRCYERTFQTAKPAVLQLPANIHREWIECRGKISTSEKDSSSPKQMQ